MTGRLSPLSWWFLGLGVLGLLRYGTRWARVGEVPVTPVDLAWLLGSVVLIALAVALTRRAPPR